MQIEVMYFGRPSEFLMLTSEQVVMPQPMHTLEQVLNGLRQRGDRWAYELDESHVICTVNRQPASLSDSVADGDEVNIFSRKSVCEI